MNLKRIVVLALTVATLIPQTVGALSVTSSSVQPIQTPNYNFSGVYNYRWATQPLALSLAQRSDNRGSSLGGGKTPDNNGVSLISKLKVQPDNRSSSLASRIIVKPDNTGSSLGGGKTPDNNGDSLISKLKVQPDNRSSSLASRIIIKPDNTGSSLGGGKLPSTRPDNKGESLGGGKLPNNRGQSLADILAARSSDESTNSRPDNRGSIIGSSDSSGSSTRPDNRGESLADQLDDSSAEDERPDNRGSSLQDQLDDQNDQDNDQDSDDNYEEITDNDRDNDNGSNLCDGRKYPRDIDGHWSEIYVRRLYDLCVVEGYSDGYFRPNAYVTRAELVKMGLFANGIEANHGCYDSDCGSPFYDLDSWQGQWIRPAYDRNIIQGYNLNEFRPNQPITRAEAVKVVLATYGYGPMNTTESFFKDVNGWSTGWIETARLIGLVQGIGNGNFDPDRPITRAEAAKIVAKMIEYWATNVSYDNQYRG